MSEIRKDNGMTQKQLADLLSLSENTISSYERNISDPDDETKIKLAKLYNVSIDYLMGTSDFPSPLKPTASRLIYIKNLPENASREIENFIQYMKDKYNLN